MSHHVWLFLSTEPSFESSPKDRLSPFVRSILDGVVFVDRVSTSRRLPFSMSSSSNILFVWFVSTLSLVSFRLLLEWCLFSWPLRDFECDLDRDLSWEWRLSSWWLRWCLWERCGERDLLREWCRERCLTVINKTYSD